MHPKLARLVTRGRHHTACSCATNSDGNPAQRRIVTLFHGRVESVHVDVDDAAETGRQVRRVRHLSLAMISQANRRQDETRPTLSFPLSIEWSAVMLLSDDRLIDICPLERQDIPAINP